MSDFIVISHVLGAIRPRVSMRTPNQEYAEAYACKQVRLTHEDATVFNLDTGDIVAAYSHEPGDPA